MKKFLRILLTFAILLSGTGIMAYGEENSNASVQTVEKTTLKSLPEPIKLQEYINKSDLPTEDSTTEIQGQDENTKKAKPLKYKKILAGIAVGVSVAALAIAAIIYKNAKNKIPEFTINTPINQLPREKLDSFKKSRYGSHIESDDTDIILHSTENVHHLYLGLSFRTADVLRKRLELGGELSEDYTTLCSKFPEYFKNEKCSIWPFGPKPFFKLYAKKVSIPKADLNIKKQLNLVEKIEKLLENKSWVQKNEDGTLHKHNVLFLGKDKKSKNSEDVEASFDTLPGLKITKTSEDIDNGYNEALCKFRHEHEVEVNKCKRIEREKTNCYRSGRDPYDCDEEATSAKIANGLLNNKNA